MQRMLEVQREVDGRAVFYSNTLRALVASVGSSISHKTLHEIGDFVKLKNAMLLMSKD